ncbi:MAG: mechanosensitive ion channel family protein [Sphingosinicella sp.]
MSELVLPAIGAADLYSALAALAVVAFAYALGWAAGRYVGPHFARLLEGRVAAEAFVASLCALTRHAVAWLALAVALRIESWLPAGALVLGLGAAAAAFLLVRRAGQSFGLPTWISWPLGLFLFVAILADAVGGLAPINAALDRVAFTVGSRRLSLLVTLQILFALLALCAVVRLANRLVGRLVGRSRTLDPAQRLLIQKLAGIALIAAAFFLAIDLAGIDLTALAVFSGALGLAIGFGLQKTFGNLIAGIILLWDRSIKPGDVISVGETFGSVNKIGVRAVSIVTRDGKEYLIPNEILMTEEVVNWSYSSRDVRISIPIRIAKDCDVRLAHRLMVEAANASKRVLDSPQPVVWMTDLGESSIDHEIRVWIQDPEAGLGAVRSDILNRVWELFNQHGIKIPYPERDIRVKEWPSAVSEGQPAELPPVRRKKSAAAPKAL